MNREKKTIDVRGVKAALLGAAALLLLAGCVSMPGEPDAPEVEFASGETAYISPAASPDSMDAFSRGISVDAGEDAIIQSFTVTVSNEQGQTVRTTTREAPTVGTLGAAGDSVDVPARVVWNGRDENNNFVSEGPYTIVAIAVDNLGRTGRSRRIAVVVDNTLPTANVETPYNLFSPNGDGRRETLPIVQEGSEEQSWRGAVVSPKGSTVRVWTWSDQAPPEISWDGTNDEGNLAPDGRYRYTLVGIDRAGNRTRTSVANIRLSTETYSLSLAPEVDAFSPNGDGVRDTMPISVDVAEPQSALEWSLAVINSQGDEVLSRSGEGSPPSSFEFSGRRGGSPLAEGDYRATMEVLYRNRNNPSATSEPFTLDVTAPQAEVNADADSFSPNGDGTADTLRLQQEGAGAAQWTGRIVTADSASDTIMRESWEELPEAFVWNGQTTAGQEATSGEYRYILEGRDRAGNAVSARTSVFVLDVEGPAIDVTVSPKPFTPDGDGNNDTLRISVEASDNQALRSWQVSIYDPRGNQFTQFSGEGAPPSPITWNGRGAEDERVQAASDYRAVVGVTDENGNESATEVTVPVGILVVEDSSGDLRIRVSNIHFVPFEADYLNLEEPELVRQNKQILDRVAEILQEYPEREVRIEGHAVHIYYEDEELKQEEQEQTLIPLSQERAEVIAEALIERGVREDRLIEEGLGGSEPIVPHSDLQNRWKNRRVEFELPRQGVTSR